MTVPLTDCPPDELIAKYLDDALSPTVSGPLTAHIDGCSTCQAKLDTLTADGAVSDRLRALSSAVLRGPQPDSTLDRGVVATTATDTQMFGSDGIPMVPRVHVPRPSVPGYEVEGEIGRGGMGVVFRATHKRLNRTVALKMVLAAGVADPRVTQRFLFEAEVLAKVQHPQVVQVYEVNMFTAPTGVVFPFLAMELLSGGTLVQWAGGRQIPAGEAAGMMEGLARAVHAVHQQGIVHRDLKPANILRSTDGVFKVSDFGLAKLTAESGAQLTGTGMVVGTPAYMAPEQAGGDGPIGPPADVYSLGAMLFELLAGRPPFPGDDAMGVLLKVIRDDAPDVRTVRADVPRDLAAVVMKCLNKEPARRYQTADDLADDLRRFLNRRPTRARTLSAVERWWYWARRNPLIAGLLTALMVVLTAGFVVSFVMWQKAEWTAGEKQKESFRAGLLDAQAKAKAQEAEANQREADERLVTIEFDRAENRCEAGYVEDGLRRFVAALEVAERLQDEPLQRVIRVNVAAWERELFAPVRAVQPPAAVTRSAEYSPDGRWLLTGDDDCRVRVWDADTGKLLHTLDAAAGDLIAVGKRAAGARTGFTGVAAAPDGKRVAASTDDGYLVIWSVADGQVRHRTLVVSPYGRKTSLWRVGFAGGRLWLGGDEGILYGYDPDSGKHVSSLPLPGSLHPQGLAAVGGGAVLHPLTAPSERRPDGVARATSVTQVRPSADGTRLFTGDRSGRVIEWDLEANKAAVVYRFGGNPWVSGLAVSGDGRYLAATSTDGTARLWARGDPTQLFALELDGAYGGGVTLSDDGRRMVVGNADGQVVAYDTRGRFAVGAPLRRMRAGIMAARPNGGEVLIGDGDGVRVVRPPDPRFVPVPSTRPDQTARPMVRFLDFRSDGKALLVGCGGVRVFDPDTGRRLAGRREGEGEDEPLGGRFSADGKAIAFGTRHSGGVMGGEGYRERATFPANSAYITVFPVPPGDAVTLVNKGFACTCDPKTGVLRHSFFLTGLADNNPRLLLAAPGGGEWRLANREAIEFLDPANGRHLRPPLKPGGPVTGLAQTADGASLLVLVADETAQWWDPLTAQPRAAKPIPVRHRGTVSGLALSPDGKVLATASRDRSMQFWDTETGLALGPRRHHASPATALAYSPLGTQVAVGTADGLATVWQVPPPPATAPLAELKARYPALVPPPETKE